MTVMQEIEDIFKELYKIDMYNAYLEQVKIIRKIAETSTSMIFEIRITFNKPLVMKIDKNNNTERLFYEKRISNIIRSTVSCKSNFEYVFFSGRCNFPLPNNKSSISIKKMIEGRTINKELKKLDKIIQISLIFQVILAISEAYSSVYFTHYDLHGSNVIVSDTKKEFLEYKNTNIKINTFGKKIVIIDFGKSILYYQNVRISNSRTMNDGFYDICRFIGNIEYKFFNSNINSPSIFREWLSEKIVFGNMTYTGPNTIKEDFSYNSSCSHNDIISHLVAKIAKYYPEIIIE